MLGLGETRSSAWLAARLSRPLRWLVWIAAAALVAWTVLAVGYAPLPWPGVRALAAASFAVFAAWAQWRSRRGWPLLLLAALVLGWWLAWSTIQPSHQRELRPEGAVQSPALTQRYRTRDRG